MIKKRNKILLIDDATELVQSLVILLESHEYEVQKAYNGKQGLKKLETYEPDLIILDMDMPVMGGIEFYHTFLEQNGGKCKYPVLVFTGRESLESVFKDLEVEGFMSKPFDFDELINKIDAIFLERYGHIEPVNAPKSAEEVSAIKIENVLVFEKNEDFFDQIVTNFANEDIRVDPGLSGENIPEQKTIENALHRVKTKNASAVLIHIESLSPLHRSYNWIRPVVDMAKEKHMRIVFYTGSEAAVSEELKSSFFADGVDLLLQSDSATDITQAVLQALSQKQ